MTALTVLFIGGTGIISSACAPASIAAGHQLTILNRGATPTRPLPEGAEVVHADIRDPASVREALGRPHASTWSSTSSRSPPSTCRPTSTCSPATSGSTCSSARRRPTRSRRPRCRSASRRRCATRGGSTPATRSPARTCWSRAYREDGFPATIVRPSHTYDRTAIPTMSGWTDVDRMRRGLPVVVHGDGTSLWTLTHHADFAAAFVGLLGNPQAYGDSFTITSDFWLTWDQIYTELAVAAGVPKPQLVHVTSEAIAAASPSSARACSATRRTRSSSTTARSSRLVPGWQAKIPFAVGAREIVDWYDADASRRVVDPAMDALWDKLTATA